MTEHAPSEAPRNRSIPNPLPKAFIVVSVILAALMLAMTGGAMGLSVKGVVESFVLLSFFPPFLGLIWLGLGLALIVSWTAGRTGSPS